MTPPADEGLTFDAGPDAARRYTLEEKKMYLESGLLGRVFGARDSAPMNISGLVVCLFVATGVGIVILRGVNESVEYFKIVMPLISLVLGYLFGKKT